MARGMHLLVDAYGVSADICNDDQRLLETLALAARAAGESVISQVRYKFGADSPPGCTAIVLLDESHCSAHTYADEGLIAFDFFTCGNVDPLPIWERIRTELGIQNATVKKHERFTGAPMQAAEANGRSGLDGQ